MSRNWKLPIWKSIQQEYYVLDGPRHEVRLVVGQNTYVGFKSKRVQSYPGDRHGRQIPISLDEALKPGDYRLIIGGKEA